MPVLRHRRQLGDHSLSHVVASLVSDAAWSGARTINVDARRATDHQPFSTAGVSRPCGQRRPHPGPSVRAARSAASCWPWREAPPPVPPTPVPPPLLVSPRVAELPPRLVALLHR